MPQDKATQDAMAKINLGLDKRQKFRANDVIENGAANEEQPVSDKPKFVFRLNLDFDLSLLTRGARKFLLNVRTLAQFFGGFRHHMGIAPAARIGCVTVCGGRNYG